MLTHVTLHSWINHNNIKVWIWLVQPWNGCLSQSSANVESFLYLLYVESAWIRCLGSNFLKLTHQVYVMVGDLLSCTGTKNIEPTRHGCNYMYFMTLLTLNMVQYEKSKVYVSPPGRLAKHSYLNMRKFWPALYNGFKGYWLAVSNSGHVCNKDTFRTFIETNCVQWILV